MKKFKFVLKDDYGRNGPRFYDSDDKQYYRYFEKCRAQIESRVNGPKTAYAKITYFSAFFTGQEFGYYLYAHFSGNNCFKQAQGWCNWLLNHPPTGQLTYKKNLEIVR